MFNGHMHSIQHWLVVRMSRVQRANYSYLLSMLRGVTQAMSNLKMLCPICHAVLPARPIAGSVKYQLSCGHERGSELPARWPEAIPAPRASHVKAVVRKPAPEAEELEPTAQCADDTGPVDEVQDGSPDAAPVWQLDDLEQAAAEL